MNVIADSHEAVFTKPLSRVTVPVFARSFEMSMPRSPSVPTTMGSSVSSVPMRSTADGSLIRRSLLFAASVPLAAERFRATSLAYGVAVAVAERDLTSRRQLLPWTGVVAPWLLSRIISIVVLLVAVNDPARGSRFEQVATRWDGAFYLDIARNGYGPVDIPFPKWPFFPLLPGLIRTLSEVADDKAAIFVLNQLVFLVALAGVYRLASRRGRPAGRRPLGVVPRPLPGVVRVLDDVPVGDLPRRVGVGVRVRRGAP